MKNNVADVKVRKNVTGHNDNGNKQVSQYFKSKQLKVAKYSSYNKRLPN